MIPSCRFYFVSLISDVANGNFIHNTTRQKWNTLPPHVKELNPGETYNHNLTTGYFKLLVRNSLSIKLKNFGLETRLQYLPNINPAPKSPLVQVNTESSFEMWIDIKAFRRTIVYEKHVTLTFPKMKFILYYLAQRCQCSKPYFVLLNNLLPQEIARFRTCWYRYRLGKEIIRYANGRKYLCVCVCAYVYMWVFIRVHWYYAGVVNTQYRWSMLNLHGTMRPNNLVNKSLWIELL